MPKPPRPKGILLYLAADLCSALLAWMLFFLFRKLSIEGLGSGEFSMLEDPNFGKGLVSLSLFWLMLYFLTNTYRDIYKKSRALELLRTAWQTLMGGVVIFFTLLLNDVIRGYTDYYWLFFGFLGIHFVVTASCRELLLFIAKSQIEGGRVQIATLLTGTPEHMKKVREEYARQPVALPFRIRDEKIWTADTDADIADGYEEVVIALDHYNDKHTENFIIRLLAKDITVKLLADELDILSGKYKTQNIFGSTLIEIETDVLQPWQKVSKRLGDSIIALGGLILSSPLLLYLALQVKRSSPGPVLYSQERIGKNGKPFHIYKFRTMRTDAENGQPMLTTNDDQRITPIGRLLRKYRLDELPQLWNVLLGDMSLVGPRPERQYFIRQIIAEAPQYQLLQRIRPGITSLGMVKFGYAHNIQEMMQRMRYDLLYLENMSLLMDLKIMAYTVLTVLKGKGK